VTGTNWKGRLCGSVKSRNTKTERRQSGRKHGPQFQRSDRTHCLSETCFFVRGTLRLSAESVVQPGEYVQCSFAMVCGQSRSKRTGKNRRQGEKRSENDRTGGSGMGYRERNQARLHSETGCSDVRSWNSFVMANGLEASQCCHHGEMAKGSGTD